MLQAVVQRFVRVGDLTLIDPKGRESHYGDGTGTPVTVRLNGALTPLKLALNPTLKLGE